MNDPHTEIIVDELRYAGAESCTWHSVDYGEYYETDCGHAFQLTCDTVADHGFKFCVFCGKPLVAVEFDEGAPDGN